MNKRVLIACAMGATLLMTALPLAALAQDEAVPGPEGVQWQLASLAGAPVAEGVEVTLFLETGEVVGDAGCNSYFGSYTLDGESLTFAEPFGVTQKLCQGAAQETEDAYLPLLQATSTWSIDEEGALSLADAEGAAQLVYGEAAVDVTASDVDALVATLADLQAQIDAATAEVKALDKEAKKINVNKFDRRLSSAEDGVAKLDDKVGKVNFNKLGKRLSAVEKGVADSAAAIVALDKAVTKFKNRVKAVEQAQADQEKRLAALEEAVLVPTPTE